jgi:hypothetical protein
MRIRDNRYYIVNYGDLSDICLVRRSFKSKKAAKAYREDSPISKYLEVISGTKAAKKKLPFSSKKDSIKYTYPENIITMQSMKSFRTAKRRERRGLKNTFDNITNQ